MTSVQNSGTISGMHGEELVTLTEARVRLHELVKDLEAANVVLLRHGKPVGMMVGYEHYASLLARIEDLEDRIAVHEARAEGPDMAVPWDKVKAESGLLTAD